jgi:hypothetical protein
LNNREQPPMDCRPSTVEKIRPWTMDDTGGYIGNDARGWFP